MSLLKKISSSFLLAGFIVPLNQKGAWQDLAYRSIPKNQLVFSDQGLEIQVKKSSSPTFFPLPEPMKIHKISAKAKVSGGGIQIPSGKTQGHKGFDDFPFRLGIVEKGDQRLNWFQRQVAPAWVLKLHSLAPEGIGVKGINYIVATNQKKLIGQSRKHPLSDLIHETYVTMPNDKGEITIEKSFDPPVEGLALWIGADGDDTGSSFDLVIEKIEINGK
ncbi:MAG: hypothetical protein KDD33_04905 [Bdellovibrionales bacterium]|nr:hypothetical protein [Bdellovibrionales bacterium]